MITRGDLDERVREWQLRDETVEKDYVLGWTLWGVGTDPKLADAWIFKGGTCLKKCYIETFRFSEDLDFTVIPGGPITPEEVAPLIQAMLGRITAESGIDFSIGAPQFKMRPSGQSAEGRIYYRGPRGAPQAARIKLDLNADEKVARPTVLRPIAHTYPDKLPDPGTVRCYSFEEVFAEKIRAMGERSRPRDLYDIVNLFRRADLREHPEVIREVLVEKCHSKGIAVPTLQSIQESRFRAELESEWANMLGHQLPQLPPFQQFWEELPALFEWLEGRAAPLEPAGIPGGANEERWAPPPTVWLWGAGAPIETIRFAAANRLCVDLGYQGSVRTIEPYSLRRTRDGNMLLYAVKADTSEVRGYRIDRIQSVRVTQRPFRPRYAIELSASGAVHAPAVARTAMPSLGRPAYRRAPGSGLVYVIECPVCNKKFRRSRHDTRLNEHKGRDGYRCYGRTGYLVDTVY